MDPESATPSAIYARPVFILLGGVVVGILAGRHFPGHSAWVSAGAALVGLAILFLGRAARQTSGLAPLVLMAALGYLSLHPWTALPTDPHHIRNAIPGVQVEIEGSLATVPKRDERLLSAVLALQRIRQPEGWQPARGTIRLTIRGDPPPPLSAGDQVKLKGNLRAIRNFANPGGFDYAQYLAWQGIHGSMSINSSSLLAVKSAPADGRSPLKRIQGRVRRIIQGLPAEAVGSDEKSVLRALLLGEREGIPRDLRRAFSRTGTAHLLAISGLHMGMVAGAAFWVLQYLLGFSRTLLLTARTRKAAAAGAIALAAAYGLLSGMAPSTQRALAMAGFALAALIIERESDLFNLLAWAALVILVWHPPGLFALSLHLSFAAVFWIIFGLQQCRWIPLLQPPCGALAPSAGKRLLRWAALSVLVTLLATLGTLPLIARAFHQVSLVGLGCNLLLVPLVGWGVLPLGLAAVAAATFSPLLCAGLLQAAAVPLRLACYLVRGVGDLPWAAVKMVSWSALEVGCYFMLLGCGLAYIGTLGATARRAVRTPAGTAHQTRRAAVWLAIAGLAVAAADIGYWVHRRFWNDDLRMTVLDVGQGTAAVVEAPRGEVLLLDGGGFADPAAFDVGERIVAPFLWQRKIASVQVLVLTHPNSDHLNGLIYIAQHFNVRELWSNGQPTDTWGYKKLQQILTSKGVLRQHCSNQTPPYRRGTLQAEILYPPANFMDRTVRGPWSDSNANSLVVKMIHGGCSILLTGDITARAERELAGMAADRLRSTVLVVPHHGSRSSSTRVLLERVQPVYAIISCGWQNRYRFPHPAVLDRLQFFSRRIFRTDLHGAVSLHSSGGRLSIRGTREP